MGFGLGRHWRWGGGCEERLSVVVIRHVSYWRSFQQNMAERGILDGLQRFNLVDVEMVGRSRLEW